MGHESRLNPFSKPSPLINTAAPVVRDGRGRILQVGDEIVVPGAPALFRVRSIERCAEAGVPDSFMDVLLVGTLKIRTPRDTPTQELLRVVSADETKPAAPIDLTDKEH